MWDCSDGYLHITTWHSGPLQKSQLPLTAEPFVLPQDLFIFIYVCVGGYL